MSLGDELAGVRVDRLLGCLARFDPVGDRCELNFFGRFAQIGYLGDVRSEARVDREDLSLFVGENRIAEFGNHLRRSEDAQIAAFAFRARIVRVDLRQFGERGATLQGVHDAVGQLRLSGGEQDMTVEIADGDFDEFKICFAENERFRSWLIYNNVKKELEINRLYSGMNRDTIGVRKVRLRYPKESLKLRFILDKYSAEIFINDGSQVLSMTYYTPLDADGISFECDGDTVIDIEKHGIFVR